jgi:hypothetical protein
LAGGACHPFALLPEDLALEPGELLLEFFDALGLGVDEGEECQWVVRVLFYQAFHACNCTQIAPCERSFC